MRIKKVKRPPAATMLVGVKLPRELHERMRAIRQARREREGADVRLCRIYREAIEQFINASGQQELLRSKILRRSA